MFGAGAETRSALASKRPGLSDARDINAAKRLSIDRRGKHGERMNWQLLLYKNPSWRSK